MSRALHDCSRCYPDPNPGKFTLPRGKTRHRGLCGTCRRELRDAQSTARILRLPIPTELPPYSAPSEAVSYLGRGA
jgi:hypothetical protein